MTIPDEELLKEAVYDAISDAAHHTEQKYGVFIDSTDTPYSRECINDEALIGFCFDKDFIIKYLDIVAVSHALIDVFIDDYFFFNIEEILYEIYSNINKKDPYDEWDV